MPTRRRTRNSRSLPSRGRIRSTLLVDNISKEIIAERKFLKKLQSFNKSGVDSLNTDIGVINIKDEIKNTKRIIEDRKNAGIK